MFILFLTLYVVTFDKWKLCCGPCRRLGEVDDANRAMQFLFSSTFGVAFTCRIWRLVLTFNTYDLRSLDEMYA